VYILKKNQKKTRKP